METESSISVSGVVAFVAIIASGPCFYCGHHLFHRYFRTMPSLEHADSKTMLEASRNHRLEMNSAEYIFALVGYAIGIGNIWRFPYVIAQNGGGAALFAYIICTALVAAPLFLFEQIVGQYTRLSTIRCFTTIRPRWMALGIASGCNLYLTSTFYGMVIAYSIPYLIQSMKEPLPWIAVGPEQYWFDTVLNNASYLDSPENPATFGPIQGHLAGALFTFWLLVFVTCGFGKHLLEKVTYVTVIMPVVLVAILVCRSVFLEGASDGLAFYLGRFHTEDLFDLKVWASACGQVVFSLSPGFGVALTYSSFSNPKEDVYRACGIVAVANASFSIFTGLATFSILGRLAFEQGVPVEEIANSSGAGLAFITLAGAMSYFGPFANVMSVLFFFTLIMVGLDSTYPFIVTLVAYVDDFREETGLPKTPTWQTNGLIIISVFFIGLLFTTRMGFEALSIMDHFVASIFLLLVVSMQSIMFSIDFGWERLNFAVTKATHGHPKMPGGRVLEPQGLFKFIFNVTTTVIPTFMGLYLIFNAIVKGYGGFPPMLIFWFGWFPLVGMILLSFLTLCNKGESTLPPYSVHDIMTDRDSVSTDEFESGHMEAPSINIAPPTNLSEVI